MNNNSIYQFINYVSTCSYNQIWKKRHEIPHIVLFALPEFTNFSTVFFSVVQRHISFGYEKKAKDVFFLYITNLRRADFDVVYPA